MIMQIGLQRVLVSMFLKNFDQFGAFDDSQFELCFLLAIGKLFLDLRFEGADDCAFLIFEVVVLGFKAVLFIDVLQDILKKHLVFLVFPLFLEEVYFLVNVVKHCFRNLAVQAHCVNTDHVVLLLGFVLELLDYWRVRLDFLEGSCVLLELFFESCMLSDEGGIVLCSFVLLELSLCLFVARLCLSMLFAVLFLHFFLSFHKSLVVADALVESFSEQAALDSKREACKATKTRKLEEIDLFILLDLRHIEVLFLFCRHLPFFNFFSWLFLFEDLIASASLAGQHLLNHEFMGR